MNMALDAEVDANFDALMAQLPKLIVEHRGKYALMRHTQIEEFFTDVRAAMEAGIARFGDRIFSVQEITDQAADLGFFSHAVDTRIA